MGLILINLIQQKLGTWETSQHFLENREILRKF